MTARKPRRHGPAARYVSPGSRELLQTCFPGLVPARVIEEALAEKARREGRLKPQGRRQA